MGKYPLTNPHLFNQLQQDLLKSVRKTLTVVEQASLATLLDRTFKQFWRTPLSSESSDLGDWLKSVLATESNSPAHHKALNKILAGLMGWEGPPDENRRLFVTKLDFCITLTTMLKRSKDLIYQLKWIEDEIRQLRPAHYAVADALIELVPDSPLGDLASVRWMKRDGLGDLGVFNWLRYQGMGRWLLMNLCGLYHPRSGALGPHVLLTSATSWLPGSSQFHLAAVPQAVLQLKTDTQPRVSHIDLFFRASSYGGEFLPVSGAGDSKVFHLHQIVRTLAEGDLQGELDYWKRRGTDRRILLVVNSYQQAEWVLNELERMDAWKGRALRLLSDDADESATSTIRAREVEQFADRYADVLIAPLMAIQRGFNILDSNNTALLGTAYFLVRPFPPPDDLTMPVLSLNAWLMRQLKGHTRLLNDRLSVDGIEAVAILRWRAFRRWNRLVQQYTRGMRGMDNDVYAEYLRDTFIVIWQTVGRLLRGGEDARVFFVDAKFGVDGQRHLLRDWQAMLTAMRESASPGERFLAEELYMPAQQAFDRALQRKEI